MNKASSNYFAILNGIDVSDKVEKKGDFTYLSWPFAVAKLREFDPSATWEVRRFDGKPFLNTDAGCFVEVAVTVQGVTLSQIHPVLDSKNRPIASPTCFEINTSIQRALVKAIALHGLGLYLYQGEDLPEGVRAQTLTEEQQQAIKKLLAENGGELGRLLSYFKVQSLGDILASDYERVIRSLQKGRRAA